MTSRSNEARTISAPSKYAATCRKSFQKSTMTSRTWRSDQICRAMVASIALLVGLDALVVRWRLGAPQLVDRLGQRGQFGQLLLGPGLRDPLRLQLPGDPLVYAHLVDVGQQLRGRAEREPAGQVPDRVVAERGQTAIGFGAAAACAGFALDRALSAACSCGPGRPADEPM